MTGKKTYKQATPRKSRLALVFEELEPRLLLSADLPVDIPAALAPDRGGDDEPVSLHEDITTTAVTVEQYAAHELVFVDTHTPDYQHLVDDLLSNSSEERLIEVVLLDNSSDGIAQVTDTLIEYHDLDAVHLISHGSDGFVNLGDTQLEFESLLANSTTIQGWSNAFSEGGDLLIYGCNLAASEDGQALVDSLARLTSADVAASDDLTGSTTLGGDWELEYQQGKIETSTAISSATQSSWNQVLAVAVGTSSSGSTADQASVTVSHTTSGTNRLMLVGVSMESSGGETVSSITYNGVSLSLIGTQDHESGGKSRVEIWGLVAPDTGTHNVVVNLSGSGHEGVSVGVMTFTGVNQTTPATYFTGDYGTEGAGGTASTTVASAANDLVFGVIESKKGTSVTPGAGQTEYWDIVASDSNGGGTTEAGAASVITSWTIDSGEWAAAAVSIQADTNNHMNGAPTDLSLSNSAVDENVDTAGGYSVGTLSAADVDAGDTHSYTIVGGADAALFSIGGAASDELILDDGILDFETQSSYQVMVRVTDSGVPGLTYDELLTIAVNDQAGNINGTVFTDEGTMNIGAGKTISLLVNGVSIESVVTGMGGAYSFTSEVNAGDAVAVFIDNDATYQGITVTVSDGSDLGGIQVFSNHIVVRNDNGGATSIADMDNALDAYADPDIHYAVIGGNLVANAVGSELLVPAGHTFIPGGDVNATSIKILGTVSGGTDTFNIVENWDSAAGSWLSNISTVNMLGTGTINSAGDSFYKLTTGAASQVTTLTSDLTVRGVLTIADSTGTLTDNGGSYDITVTGSGTPFVNNGSTVVVNKFIYSNGNPVTVTVAGGTYDVSGSLQLDGHNTGAGVTYQLNGDLVVTGAGLLQVYPTTAGVAILDTTASSYNITASDLVVGSSLFQAGFIYANNSTIDINGDVSFNWSANTTIHLGGSDWSVSGNWSNTSTSFTAGTSTVTLDGVNQQLTGSTAFYNLAKVEGSNDGTDSVLTFDNTATQTINGALTLTGLDADDPISLVSDVPGNQWSINLAAPATHALDYIVVTDSDASGSDPGQLTINPTNSFSGGNNIGWFGAIAGDDAYSVDEASTTNLGLSANDSDPDDGLDLTSIVIASGPTNGSIVVNANGTVDYAHDGSETVADSFTYTINDNLGNVSNIGTVTITVNPANDAPVVNATASDTGTEDTDVVYTHAELLTLIGATDVDDANANLSISLTNVTNGTLALSGGTGGVGTTFTFAPTANFVGNLTFDYQVSDDESPTPASSAIGTATVALAAVNDAPVVNATASDPGTEDTDVVYTHAELLTLIGATDVDDANANLSISITNVTNGTLALSGGTGGAGTNFTFAPTLNFVGNLSFDYQVSDDAAPTPATSVVGTATVALSAVNDAPVINNQTFNIDENRPMNAVVGTPAVTDADTGDTLTYSIIGGAGATAFSIHSNSGQIRVADPSQIDFETNPSLTLDIQVQDGGGLIDTATVTININDLNERPTLSNATFALDENAPNGTSVGTVTGTDQDGGDSLTYSIIGGNIGNAFTIDPVTGEITVNDISALNFEAIGNATNPAFAHQTGAANPLNGVNLGNRSTAVFVDIDGDGDLDAVIGKYDGFLNFFENIGDAANPSFVEVTGPGNPLDGFDTGSRSTPVFADIDDDGDQDLFVGDRFGGITYYQNVGNATSPAFVQVSGPGNPFDAVSVSNMSAPTLVDIDGDGDLDAFIGEWYGTVKYYENTGDAANPAFTEQTGAANPLNGVFGGICCNEWTPKPTFADLDADGDYDAFIGLKNGSTEYWENSGDAATPVFSLQTGDANPLRTAGSGGGGEAAPAFVDIDGDGDMDAFFGNASGTIRFFENKPVLNLTVQAEDGSGLNDTAVVRIDLNDVNEGPTDIDLSNNFIDENIDTSGGYSIGILSTIDEDRGDVHTYSIVGGADAALFTIGGVGADELILDDGVLDFEIQSSYQVTVRVTDSGTPGLSYDETVTITVNDLNETPTDISLSNTAVDENVDTTGGYSVGTLSATDVDAGDSHTYTIVGGADAALFTIGGTGSDELILDDGVLDFETQNSYQVTVRVTDSGTPGLIYDENLTITINDLNDAPVADNDSFTVNEGSTTNLNLVANDTDADDGLDLASIGIVSGPTNGSLVVNADGTVDYAHDGSETVADSFAYTIDDQSGVTSNTVTVNLTVTPVNDVPVATADSFTVDEGSTTSLDLVTNDTDADDGLDLTSITIVSGPANGSVVVNADGTVDYAHDGSETAADSFTYTIGDLSGATSDVGTVSLSINPVNDAPIHGVPAAQSTPGNAPLTFSSSNGNSITVADPDASGAAMEVTLSASNGTLSLAGTTGLSFNVGDGSRDATMTFTGTATDINTALNGLRFQPDADYRGKAAVQIITDDLGNAGAGGALNALDRVDITVTASARPGISQDTLPPLDELIEDTLDLPGLESALAAVDKENVDPAAEEATDAASPASGPGTTPTSDPAVEAILGSGRGVPTQADVSLPGSVAPFDQYLESPDDDRPTSVQLIHQVMRQGMVDPFTYAKMLNPLQPDMAIWESIEAMMEQMDDRDDSWYSDDKVLTTTTATGLTVSFTVGYVSWMLRAGYLSASLLTVLPLWREFDPLPVLATTQIKKRISGDGVKDSRNASDTESERIFTSSPSSESGNRSNETV